jgi:hypothetical protein
VVHDPVEAEPLAGVGVSRRLSFAAALFLGFVVAAGCGGSGSSHQRVGAGREIYKPLYQIDCTDWRRAAVSERRGTVRRLRVVATGPVGGGAGRGPGLEDKQAYKLLQHSCTPAFARGFLLYRLYGRAASLAGH